MHRLVIDTDPGVDDAHALMLAASHPQARIEAVTTVAGNVAIDKTTANACLILDALDLDCPIYQGAASGLLGPTETAGYVHGLDGLGDAGLDPSKRSVESEHAVQALIRIGRQSPGELTLVALGPLTNIALAIRLEPELPKLYKNLVSMGGAIRGMGNTTNPTAEFNVFNDPEAAHIVYQSWPEPLLVPWETVLEHSVEGQELKALLAIESPLADFFRTISAKMLNFFEEAHGRPLLLAADALAVAAALEPESIEKIERRHVQVALGEGHTRGQTSVDWFRITKGEPNVNLLLEFNDNRWRQLLKNSLG